MKNPAVYLRHILASVERIEEDLAGGESSFFGQHIVQDAVLRNLQTLAESAKRLPADLTAQAPEVDWAAIAGFRNVLVHDYLGIDLELVWRVVTRDLPPLKRAVSRLLGDEPTASRSSGPF